MGTEAEQLKAKLEKLERALTQLQTQKDEEIQQLRDVAEEAQANLKLEQQRSASLEQELKVLRWRLNSTGTKLWTHAPESH